MIQQHKITSVYLSKLVDTGCGVFYSPRGGGNARPRGRIIRRPTCAIRRVAMSWANPTVARLAIGDLTEDACGGVLICSWPMPSHVLAGYQAFAARLKAELPAEAYIYPASTPHSLSKVPPHSSAHPGVGDRPMSRPACSPVAASSSVGLSPPARAAPILHQVTLHDPYAPRVHGRAARRRRAAAARGGVDARACRRARLGRVAVGRLQACDGHAHARGCGRDLQV